MIQGLEGGSLVYALVQAPIDIEVQIGDRTATFTDKVVMRRYIGIEAVKGAAEEIRVILEGNAS